MAGYNLPPLKRLTDAFARLPGVGRKSAARLAFHLLSLTEKETEEFISSIKDARVTLHYCPVCQNLTDGELCPVCSDSKRDKTVICVVEDPRDVIKLEKSGDYKGVYHVLHGVLSPMDGIGPDGIKAKELISRLSDTEIKEIIMATNPSIEGETTAGYLSRLIKPMGITVTRLAYGIPVNGSLEYTDSVTLSRALEGRREM